MPLCAASTLQIPEAPPKGMHPSLPSTSLWHHWLSLSLSLSLAWPCCLSCLPSWPHPCWPPCSSKRRRTCRPSPCRGRWISHCCFICHLLFKVLLSSYCVMASLLMHLMFVSVDGFQNVTEHKPHPYCARTHVQSQTHAHPCTHLSPRTPAVSPARSRSDTTASTITMTVP